VVVHDPAMDLSLEGPARRGASLVCTGPASAIGTQGSRERRICADCQHLFQRSGQADPQSCTRPKPPLASTGLCSEYG
jgi:hypothetical protein